MCEQFLNIFKKPKLLLNHWFAYIAGYICVNPWFAHIVFIRGGFEYPFRFGSIWIFN